MGARACIRAGELGKRALLCDGSPRSETSFGGPTGLFSKALRDTAKRMSVDALRSLGLDDESIWTQIKGTCQDLATTNAVAMRRECVSTGATVVSGEAELVRASNQCVTVRVEGREYTAAYCLLATGSAASRPEGVPFDGARIFDADSIVGLGFLPRSIAIAGSGIVAVEFAKIFRNLGSEVTLVFRGESPKKALAKSGLDGDLSAVLVSDLARSGVVFARGRLCASFECPPVARRRLPLKIELDRSDGTPCDEVLKVDAYLAALGRTPRTPKGLSRVGIKQDEYQNILVNADLRAAPRVFAAGDCLGRPFLASVGVAQGMQAIDTMFTDRTAEALCAADDAFTSCFGADYDPDSINNNPFAFPVGIWSSPEVAWFGFTKKQAIQRGIKAQEGMALYKEVLRGIVFSPDGLLKLVIDDSDQTIIGVHIVGTDACGTVATCLLQCHFSTHAEIIHYGMELVRAKRTISDVIQSTYSAVTFHELYQCAARAAANPKVARLKRRSAGAAWAAARLERLREEAAWD